MGGVSWASDYFDELNSVRATYWPFLLYRNTSYSGKYVNGDGWTRDSYQAAAVSAPGGDELPLLSFYGGSTMFGVGQRDGHTIASEVARIAEREGYPVRVLNHGMLGYVGWQEMLLFEHFTSAGERPAIAVFYDGMNEVYAQRQTAVTGNPADTQVDAIGERIASAPSVGDGGARVARSTSTPRDVWDLYNEHSALSRLVRVLGDVVSEPVSASVTQAGSSDESTLTQHDIGVAAVKVYDRSRDLIEHVADEAGVDARFFWQPVPGWDDPTGAYSTAVGRLSDPTVSIAGCLDGHEDVYLADWHTNEEGARLVAECMWAELGPGVRSWYRGHGLERRAPVRSVGDDVVSAVPVVSLPVTAADLGEGWKASVAIPDVIAACIDPAIRSEGVPRLGGPSFSIDRPGNFGYLTTNVLRFDDDAAASAALDTVRSIDPTPCIQQERRARFGPSAEIVWSERPQVAAGPAWTGTLTVQGFATDGAATAAVRLYLVVVRRGADLVEIQAISTDVDGVGALGAAVASQLATT